LCGGDGISAFGGGGGFVVVDKQDWRESLFHVPADVVGQHAQEHVGTYSIDQPVANRGHIKFAVEGAEESLDVGEVFVAAHDIIAAQGGLGQAGAQHTDAIEGGLGGDLIVFAGEGEAVLGDVKVKVFGHFVVVDHLAHLQRDLVAPAQRALVSGGGGGDLGQLFFGGRQQLVGLLYWHVKDPARKIDAWTVTLLVVGFLPWLRTVFESITFPGGGEVRYRELKHNVERQEDEIRALQFVVAHFLADAELRVLERFAAPEPVELGSAGPNELFKAMNTLGGLGLIGFGIDNIEYSGLPGTPDAGTHGIVKHRRASGERPLGLHHFCIAPVALNVELQHVAVTSVNLHDQVRRLLIGLCHEKLCRSDVRTHVRASRHLARGGVDQQSSSLKVRHKCPPRDAKPPETYRLTARTEPAHVRK